MSEIKTILQLNSLNRTSLSGSDLLLVADIRNRETKNIETSEYVNYTNNKLNSLLSGSFTGSFYGNLIGISDTASYSLQSDYSKTSSNLLFTDDFNGTASYSISSSNTLFSISSSTSNSSSFAISSSVSDITLYAATTSSTKAFQSNYSNYSLRSYVSQTSSYLNYFGQDNGTVVSSSFSERTLYTPLAGDISDPDSAVVAKSLKSEFSLNTGYASSVLSSSTADYAEYANSSIGRLFSSVEFNIRVDDSGSISVVPTGWKNIANISVDPVVIDTYENDVGGSKYGDNAFQGTDLTRPFTITFLVKYKKNPPVSDPTANISNVNTVVISSLQLPQSNLILPTWRGGSENPPFWYSSAYPCGLDGFVIKVIAYNWFNSSNKSYNLWYFEMFKTILNGATISANVFCNINDILSVGPESTISQQRTGSMINSGRSSTTYLSKFKTLNISEISISEVISIASNENNSFNLVLFKDGNILNVKKGVPSDNVYKPNNNNANFVYYDNISSNYIIGHSNGISYCISSTAEGTVTTRTHPNWYDNILNKNVKSICGLNGTKYIFITNDPISISGGVSTSLSSINILTSINNTSPTNPTISTIRSTTTHLNSITKVNTTDAIAVGTNGVVLYIAGSTVYRVDADQTDLNSNLYNYATVSNLTDVKVYNGNVYVCGTDQYNRQCILSAKVPDNVDTGWSWTPIVLETVGNTADPADVSSLNSIYLHSGNFVSVGSSKSIINNIVYNTSGGTHASFTGDIAIKYNTIGYYDGNYLLGGSGISDGKGILNVYNETLGGS